MISDYLEAAGHGAEPIPRSLAEAATFGDGVDIARAVQHPHQDQIVAPWCVVEGVGAVEEDPQAGRQRCPL